MIAYMNCGLWQACEQISTRDPRVAWNPDIEYSVTGASRFVRAFLVLCLLSSVPNLQFCKANNRLFRRIVTQMQETIRNKQHGWYFVGSDSCPKRDCNCRA